MSKNDNNEINKEFDPLANKIYSTAELAEQNNQEKEFLNQQVPTEFAQDSFSFESIAQSPAVTSELSTLSSAIAIDGRKIDKITEAIRREILEKQREALRDYFKKPENSAKLDEKIKEDLAKQIESDQKFREFLSKLEKEQDEEKRKLLNAALNTALNDPATKKKLEVIEIAGYKSVHLEFKDSFKTIAWDGPTGEDNNKNTTQSQKIMNGAGNEICTLTETTHAIKPITVLDGTNKPVTINSYRTIDFPVKLKGVSGSMHLSMAALDENGNRVPADQAVYFTAHYEEGPEPDKQPFLKEVSSPMPIKFMGEGKDAVGYIEHGGKIYTLPVTRDKYQEMMQEVAINKGQSVDLSQNAELANDKFRNEEIGKGASIQKEQEEKKALFSELPFNDLTIEETLEDTPFSKLPFPSQEVLEEKRSKIAQTTSRSQGISVAGSFKGLAEKGFESNKGKQESLEKSSASLGIQTADSNPSINLTDDNKLVKETEKGFESNKGKQESSEKSSASLGTQTADSNPTINLVESIRKNLSNTTGLQDSSNKGDLKQEIISKFNQQTTFENKKLVIEDLIENKDLSNKERLNILDELAQQEKVFVEKNIVTTNVLQDPTKLQSSTSDKDRYGNEIDRAQKEMRQEKANIREDVKVKKLLFDARNKIANESLSKSAPITKTKKRFSMAK